MELDRTERLDHDRNSDIISQALSTQAWQLIKTIDEDLETNGNSNGNSNSNRNSKGKDDASYNAQRAGAQPIGMASSSTPKSNIVFTSTRSKPSISRWGQSQTSLFAPKPSSGSVWSWPTNHLQQHQKLNPNPNLNLNLNLNLNQQRDRRVLNRRKTNLLANVKTTPKQLQDEYYKTGFASISKSSVENCRFSRARGSAQRPVSSERKLMKRKNALKVGLGLAESQATDYNAKASSANSLSIETGPSGGSRSGSVAHGQELIMGLAYAMQSPCSGASRASGLSRDVQLTDSFRALAVSKKQLEKKMLQ
eukprot:1364795-Amorphochlora_amoeboformis.AAC.1